MKKKITVLTLCALLFALCASAQAQQPKRVPRIGYLHIGSQLGPGEAFLQGMRDLGYVDGKNIVIEYKGDPERREDRLPELAADLVRQKVDVIVALDPPAARAAKNATKTIPIVMRSTADPVQAGLVASLARPGGNITGVTSISTELYGKRLELLKEVIPRLSRVGVLRSPDRNNAGNLKEMEIATRSLNLQLQTFEVRSRTDFENAFTTAGKERVQALITIRNPLFNAERKRIAELAIKSRLPAIYDDRAYIDGGGLMSYGTNLADLYRRAATYVDKILKGAKPADLPVEQPTKFELVINLKAAKQIGLTIPPNVLARASARASMPKKVLLVDNEPRSRNIVAEFLREEGYQIDEADDGVSALQLLNKKSFDLLICDLLMPRMSGFDVMAQMKSRSLSIPVILITGYPEALVEKGLGDLPRFTKPFKLYDLLHKVRELLTA
jgi:putative ABC transport system substrate-binding protein